MAQTQYSVAMACGYVAISEDCVTYTDISGYASIVSVPEQTRITGEAYTFEGDIAIIHGGKRQPIPVQVSIIYTSACDGHHAATRLECSSTRLKGR